MGRFGWFLNPDEKEGRYEFYLSDFIVSLSMTSWLLKGWTDFGAVFDINDCQSIDMMT